MQWDRYRQQIALLQAFRCDWENAENRWFLILKMQKLNDFDGVLLI